jgi:hypothetical protein
LEGEGAEDEGGGLIAVNCNRMLMWRLGRGMGRLGDEAIRGDEKVMRG